ncbi:MAG TPA: DUF2207 domain-containing protein [Candidatus Polarisedimenticolia bacterium]|nr:DUF2207 domain-containing protein [Candidatus Polarisedimenticolia bacterium]
MSLARRCLLLCLLALAAVIPAAGRELSIRHFDEQVQIQPDGTIEVTEIIEAQFIGTNWHGIYRIIPVEYTTPQGLNYTLFLDPLSVTDDDGHPLKYERSRKGRYTKFKIFIPNANNSTRTIIFRYRVLDALRFFDDHDELYWNVTGDDWDVPIQSASAHIELPPGVTGLHALAYTGAFGSRAQDAQVDVKDNIVEIRTTRPLGFHEGLTAVAGWDKGFVRAPGPVAKAWLMLRSNWPFFLPIAIFLGMFQLWWTRGRDPERDAITVQYEPPDKLTPAECGTLVDNEAGMRDITATLVDLAVKGYLTIEQKENSGLLAFVHHRDYVFHLQKPAAQWTDARPHEQQMLAALFGGGADLNVKLSELQNHFYTHLPAIRDAIFDALVADGYYLHRPDKVRQGYLGAGMIIGFLLWAGAGSLANATGIVPFTWFITGLVTGAIICGFGWFMPARTITGAKTFAKILGFEDFLGRVESDRIERLERTPELFEKYLPYAMALHVEKKWVQAFAGITMQPPAWYQGSYGSGFMPYVLVNDLNMMSAQAGSVMASSPRGSSGGSGFGGGGGSGGGFGGGGGGGF